MIDFINIRDKVSPQLIREISGVLANLRSGEGFLLRDDQGIAILAEDKGDNPLVFCFSIPVPLTVEAGRDLLSLCEKTCNQAGIDTANSGNIFLGCFDLLDQLITNELAVMNIADVVGALHVQRHLNNGIDLAEQVKNNNYLALTPGVKAKFSIIKNGQLIQLDGDISPRLRL